MWEKKKKRNQIAFFGASGGYDPWGYSKISGQYDFLYELNDYSLFIVMCWPWSHAIIAQM